jgi:hypothetical protein
MLVFVGASLYNLVLEANHMVEGQEKACTESILFPWHFPAPCSRAFRDFEEAFVQPAKFQKIGQRWLHDPRGPTLPSLKDELMSASILKASLLCNRAPMQQCSHMNSISLWPPKCCSLLGLPTFRMELVKSSTITLLLYAAYLPTFLMFRTFLIPTSHGTAFSAGPLRQRNFRGEYNQKIAR